MRDAWFFTLLGAVLFGGSAWSLYLRVRPRKWLTATGRILKSEVRWKWYKPSPHEFEVQYVYEVDGYNFIGENRLPGNLGYAWSFGIPSLSSARFERARYPLGATVAVYYNPRNPRQSALEWGALYVPALFMVAGVAIVYFSIL